MIKLHHTTLSSKTFIYVCTCVEVSFRENFEIYSINEGSGMMVEENLRVSRVLLFGF